jgi:hypothetical protein
MADTAKQTHYIQVEVDAPGATAEEVEAKISNALSGLFQATKLPSGVDMTVQKVTKVNTIKGKGQ